MIYEHHCPQCGSDIWLWLTGPYYAPRNDYYAFHCDRCYRCKLADWYEPQFEGLHQYRDLELLKQANQRMSADDLRCECGGSMSTLHPPRCPECAASLMEIMPDRDEEPRGITLFYFRPRE